MGCDGAPRGAYLGLRAGLRSRAFELRLQAITVSDVTELINVCKWCKFAVVGLRLMTGIRQSGRYQDGKISHRNWHVTDEPPQTSHHVDALRRWVGARRRGPVNLKFSPFLFFSRKTDSGGH